MKTLLLLLLFLFSLSIFGQSRLDISVGTSRVFQGNGDYRFPAYEAGVNVSLLPAWSMSVNVIGGSSEVRNNYSYKFIQPSLNIYWSPFPDSKFHEFRIGTGVGNIWHNPWNIACSRDGGPYTYKYDKDDSSAITLNFIVEERVFLYKNIYLGAKLFGSPDLEGSSLLWGAGVSFGLKLF